MSLDRPNWLPDPKTYKNSLESKLARAVKGTFTTPYRGIVVADYLNTLVRRESLEEVNFLEVGVGGTKIQSPIFCPYEPYHIAARSDQLGIDYKGVILDRDSRVLNNLRGRKRIYFAEPGPNANEADQLAFLGWLQYLEQTGQERRIIHNAEEQLVFNRFLGIPFTEKIRGGIALAQGIDVADVPESFTNKLQTGEVRLKFGDIATASLKGYGAFDFAVMLRVTPYLNTPGQQLAIFNMAEHLTKRGALMFDDYREVPIMGESNGWLDGPKLQDLSLKVENIFQGGKNTSDLVILRRV